MASVSKTPAHKWVAFFLDYVVFKLRNPVFLNKNPTTPNTVPRIKSNQQIVQETAMLSAKGKALYFFIDHTCLERW